MHRQSRSISLAVLAAESLVESQTGSFLAAFLTANSCMACGGIPDEHVCPSPMRIVGGFVTRLTLRKREVVAN